MDTAATSAAALETLRKSYAVKRPTQASSTPRVLVPGTHFAGTSAGRVLSVDGIYRFVPDRSAANYVATEGSAAPAARAEVALPMK
jgi:hypothetical protein